MQRKKPKKKRYQDPKHEVKSGLAYPGIPIASSQIIVLEGTGARSQSVHNCSTLVLQAKKKGKPTVSVLWHAHPYHVTDPYADEKYNILQKRDPTYAQKTVEETKRKLIEDGKKGAPLQGFITETLHPKTIIDSMTSVLEERRPNTKIVATLIPGSTTFEELNKTNVVSKAAFEKLHGLLKRYQRDGRIQRVSRRGIHSKNSIGSEHVIVSKESGRIYRTDLRQSYKKQKGIV